MKNIKSTFRMLWIILVILLIGIDVYAENHYLRIKIHGINYDSLYIYGNDINRNKFLIRGDKQNDTWQFSIPDSIYIKASQGYSIAHRLYNPRTDYAYKMSIHSVIDKDTTLVGLMFDEKYSDVDLTYLSNAKERTSFVVNDSLVSGTMYRDIFFTKLNRNSESYIYNKYIGSFGLYSDNDSLYYVNLQNSLHIIKENPDSYYLMFSLTMHCPYSKNREDLYSLYNGFTNDVKESYWGKQVKRYIDMKRFDNMQLPECKTGIIERVVEDSSKYNLIIFSASWCGACHKAIPALKKVCSELGSKLEMTYISLDEPATVKEWGKLMIKENIPWRSLLAGKDVKAVRDKYLVYGIPYMILVYPGRGMHMEIMENEWERYLYRVVK